MTYLDISFRKNQSFRFFKSDVDPNELKWHYDEQDREITVLRDTDWQFQFDNELPFKLNLDDTVKIPKGTMHRVIKGEKDLAIKISYS